MTTIVESLVDATATVAANAQRYFDMRKALAGATRTYGEWTANGSFVVPDGVTKIMLDGTGGGAGGGGSDSSAAGGGASGGGRALGEYAVTPGEILTRTIGQGGGSATNGGTTTVVSNLRGTLFSATGGTKGGNGLTGTFGLGASTSGMGSGGQINQAGTLGVNGTFAGSTLFGGPGGGAPNGGGYTFSPSQGGPTGAGGTYPGGGGSGAAGQAAGGTGANGRIIFAYFQELNP